MIDTIRPLQLSKYKRTKIIATLGPATNSYEAVKKMIDLGANGIRLNFSHGTHEERDTQIAWIRRASQELDKPVAIIQDLQGPKIRLGEFEGEIRVKKGDILKLAYKADYESTSVLPTQYDLAKKVKRGERLYIFDGKVKSVIRSIKAGVIYAEVQNDGVLLKRKGINLPDTDFGGDVITAKDRADLAYGSGKDIDYVAMSFIQTAADIEKMRRLIHNFGGERNIIAKIETKLAIDNLEEIMQVTDVAMVARGDLAVETSAEMVPVVQRKVISLGIQYAKPTVVATQMLASMVESPEPSRAEVSDVATAVYLGADCVMLSDETAMGQHPFEAVSVMKRIIMFAQENGVIRVDYVGRRDRMPTRELAISRGVISLADGISAKAIVAETKSGATILQIVSERSHIPVIAVTDVPRTAQQLAIVYDVKSFVRPVSAEAGGRLTDFLQKKKVFKKGDVIVGVSGQYPGVVGTTDTIKVRQLN